MKNYPRKVGGLIFKRLNPLLFIKDYLIMVIIIILTGEFRYTITVYSIGTQLFYIQVPPLYLDNFYMLLERRVDRECRKNLNKKLNNFDTRQLRLAFIAQ